MRSVKKVPRLKPQNFFTTIVKTQTTRVTLRSNHHFPISAMPPCTPGKFSWDSPHLHCHNLLDGFHIWKTSSIDSTLELGEREKITQSQVKCVERLLQHGDVLDQKLPDA